MPAPKHSKIVPVHLVGVLPLQEAVLFPNTVIPLAVIKKPGIQLVEEALREGKPIGLTVLKDRETENPGPDDIQRTGTIDRKSVVEGKSGDLGVVLVVALE